MSKEYVIQAFRICNPFCKQKMASFHARSNSLPYKSHPVLEDLEDHLHRLKGSDATSPKSVCSKLSSLVDLQDGIKNLIQLPSIQRNLCRTQFGDWIKEILDRSIALVDLCEFSRHVVSLAKESALDLESSVRRNRCETDAASGIESYVASRRRMNKIVDKQIKNLMSRLFNQSSTTFLVQDNEFKDIAMVVQEIDAYSFSVLKSVLTLISGGNGRSRQRSWSFLSKLGQTSFLHSESLSDQSFCPEDLLFDCEWSKNLKNIAAQDILKKLKASETIIHELERELQCLFRSLVKTRVYLLNVHSDQ